VFDVTVNSSRQAIDIDGLMYGLAVKASVPPIEEANNPVIHAVAIAHRFAEQKMKPLQRVGMITGRLHDPGNIIGQGFVDPFIGIEAQNPVIRSLLRSELFLGTVSGPVVVDDTGSMRFSDTASVVGTAGVDNDDFVSPFYAFNTGSDILLLITSDDGNSDRSLLGAHGQQVLFFNAQQYVDKFSREDAGEMVFVKTGHGIGQEWNQEDPIELAEGHAHIDNLHFQIL